MLPRLGQETVPNQFLTRQVTLPTQDRSTVAQHSSRSFPTGNCRGSAAGEGCCWLPVLSSREIVFRMQTSPRSMLLTSMSPEGTCLCFLMTFYSPKWCSHACDNGLIFTACGLALSSCECPCGARGLWEAMERVFQGSRFHSHIHLSLSQQH